jgi:hypothetical protein
MNSSVDVRRPRRAWHRLGIALVGSAIAASTLLPTGAWAVPPQPPDLQVGDPPHPAQTVPTCTAQSWSSPVVKLHVAAFTGNRAAMEDAVRDVNAQIAEVGGSSVRIESTSTTTDPFHISPYYDGAPVIHVGFQPILDPGVAASTWNRWSCERFITVDTDLAWNYGTPEDSTTDGDRYYNAGKVDPSTTIYFRVSYQHELLHAFGIANGGHPSNVYSFLNYGARPWVHAPVDAMIRPLPYDVRELRRLFPASGSRTEVAVTNTWMVRENSTVTCAPNINKVEELDPDLVAFCNAPPADVTLQKMLCVPTVGDSPDASKAFASYCGDSGATAVCPGTIVQVHYALANYSTADVDVTANVWFSLDDVWDAGDVLSPTAKTYSVGAASAQNKFWGYEVPTLSSALISQQTYYVIVRATATTSAGVTAKDSIPLRGTVTSGPNCLSPAPATTGPIGPLTFP